MAVVKRLYILFGDIEKHHCETKNWSCQLKEDDSSDLGNFDEFYEQYSQLPQFHSSVHQMVQSLELLHFETNELRSQLVSDVDVGANTMAYCTIPLWIDHSFKICNGEWKSINMFYEIIVRYYPTYTSPNDFAQITEANQKNILCYCDSKTGWIT